MLYPFICDVCGEKMEVRSTIEDRDSPRICRNGHSMRRVLVFPMAEVWAGKFYGRVGQKDPKDGTAHLGPSW